MWAMERFGTLFIASSLSINQRKVFKSLMHIVWGEILYLVLRSSSYPYLPLIRPFNRQMVRTTRNSNGDSSNTTNGEHHSLRIRTTSISMPHSWNECWPCKLNSCKPWCKPSTPYHKTSKLNLHFRTSTDSESLRTRPPTLSQAKDPLKADDWFKAVEKKLSIA